MNDKLKTFTVRKLRDIGLTLRVAAEAIEYSELTQDITWLSDGLPVSQALFTAADGISEISDQLEAKQ